MTSRVVYITVPVRITADNAKALRYATRQAKNDLYVEAVGFGSLGTYRYKSLARRTVRTTKP